MDDKKVKEAEMPPMQERREHPRMLCADLITVEWRDRNGIVQSVVANLEDISTSGACLQMEEDIPPQTVVQILHEKGNFEGKVRYSVFRDIGYFVGIEFDPANRWDARRFKPMHMLDPRRLNRPTEEKDAGTIVIKQ
jgi:hypothetical protein